MLSCNYRASLETKTKSPINQTVTIKNQTSRAFKTILRVCVGLVEVTYFRAAWSSPLVNMASTWEGKTEDRAALEKEEDMRCYILGSSRLCFAATGGKTSLICIFFFFTFDLFWCSAWYKAYLSFTESLSFEHSLHFSPHKEGSYKPVQLIGDLRCFHLKVTNS